MFTSTRKYRRFDLQKRLGEFSTLKSDNDNKIKFARLPKKKIRSVWWLVIFFIFVLYFFFYLKNI